MIKKCSKCKIEKSLTEFKKHKGRKDGIYNQCKSCVREYRQKPESMEMARQQRREHRLQNIEKYRAYARKFRDTPAGIRSVMNSNLKISHGITFEEYQSMLEKQQHRCAICGMHQHEVERRFHVDHDHKTGKNRALLCHHCNTALGLFKENQYLLNKAIEYLQEHQQEVTI